MAMMNKQNTDVATVKAGIPNWTCVRCGQPFKASLGNDGLCPLCQDCDALNAENAKSARVPEHADTKHSPAPWHINTACGEFRIEDAKGQTVFLIGDERRLIPMPADQKIIASAPALLEALKACEHELTEALTPEGIKAGACTAIKAARAALALAEGGK